MAFKKLYIWRKKDRFFPSSLLINDQTITCKFSIAENFHNLFISFEKKHATWDQKYLLHISNLIWWSERFYSRFTPNSLPHKTVKQVKSVTPFPPSELINKSFLQGIFPSLPKIAEVVPVFKRESRLLCSNCRPIKILSSASKIIEKLMDKKLKNPYNKKDAFTIYNLASVWIVLQIIHPCQS